MLLSFVVGALVICARVRSDSRGIIAVVIIVIINVDVKALHVWGVSEAIDLHKVVYRLAGLAEERFQDFATTVRSVGGKKNPSEVVVVGPGSVSSILVGLGIFADDDRDVVILTGDELAILYNHRLEIRTSSYRRHDVRRGNKVLQLGIGSIVKENQHGGV